MNDHADRIESIAMDLYRGHCAGLPSERWRTWSGEDDTQREHFRRAARAAIAALEAGRSDRCAGNYGHADGCTSGSANHPYSPFHSCCSGRAGRSGGSLADAANLYQQETGQELDPRAFCRAIELVAAGRSGEAEQDARRWHWATHHATQHDWQQMAARCTTRLALDRYADYGMSRPANWHDHCDDVPPGSLNSPTAAAPQQPPPVSGESRFFIDHGIVHDRLTGKHLRGTDEYGDKASDLLAVLQELEGRSMLRISRARLREQIASDPDGDPEAFSPLQPPPVGVDEAFAVAMQGRSYGSEETRNAHDWFKAGFAAAISQQEAAPSVSEECACPSDDLHSHKCKLFTAPVSEPAASGDAEIVANLQSELDDFGLVGIRQAEFDAIRRLTTTPDAASGEGLHAALCFLGELESVGNAKAGEIARGLRRLTTTTTAEQG